MPSWSDIRALFDRDWNVIKGTIVSAPVSVALIIIAIFSAAWGAQLWRYGAQLENKDSIIAARDATLKRYEAELHDYQRKLSASSPEEAKEKFDSVRDELQKTQAALADLKTQSAPLSPRDNKYVCKVSENYNGRYGYLIEFGVKKAPTDGLVVSITLSEPITSAKHWGNAPLHTDIQETEGTYTNQKDVMHVIFYEFSFSSPSITPERSEYAYVESQKPSKVLQVLYLDNFWQASGAMQEAVAGTEYGNCPRK
jgi:hypothetical protein